MKIKEEKKQARILSNDSDEEEEVCLLFIYL